MSQILTGAEDRCCRRERGGSRVARIWLADPRISSLFLAVAFPLTCMGQVVLDGSFGTSTPLAGPNYGITSDLGRTVGKNLFHSFSQFNLAPGDTATFSGPANIQNILSRVTGGNPSSIDGTIRTTIAGANLFLINPSGVMFGPNAAIDVSGSFAVSTANYLKLLDGAKFMAALGADDSMLSSQPVAAFGFLGGNPGSITLKGALRTPARSTLSVVGGEVSVDGGALLAPDGLINVVSAKAAGEVALDPVTWKVDASAIPMQGQISVRNAASLDASGDGGGQIVIRGGRLVVEAASIKADTSGAEASLGIDIGLTELLEVVNAGQITTATSGSGKGGDITITTPSIVLNGNNLEPDPNTFGSQTRIATGTSSAMASAKGGNIVLKSESLEIKGGAEISATTAGDADAGKIDISTSLLVLTGPDPDAFFTSPTQITTSPIPGSVGAGAGGDIVIKADSVQIKQFAQIVAGTEDAGNAGDIGITTQTLTLQDGAVATSTAGTGQGGAIRIEADTLILDGFSAFISVGTTGQDRPSGEKAGHGGSINIITRNLQVANGALIAANTFGTGDGGDINITADTILLDTNPNPTDGFPSGITATSNPPFFGEGGGGAGGDINIKVGSLDLQKGMQISSTTFTKGTGGSLDVQANSITLDNNSSIQSASLADGLAGNISLTAAQNVLLTGQSDVSTSARASSGGNIRVEAGHEIKLVHSEFNARAGPGGGGNITVSAPSQVYLLDSTFTAQAVGNGGNLSVTGPVFFILNRGDLISKSEIRNGGNISILSDFFFQSASLIDASAPFGLPGTVSVSAPQVDLSGSLIGLPSNLLGTETQLRPDCGVRLAGNISSFIVLGRGGLPIQPGGFLPSGAIPPRDEEK